MLNIRKRFNSNNIKLMIVGTITVGIGFYLAGALRSIGNFVIALIGAGITFLIFGAAVDSELSDLRKYVDKPFYELKKMRHQDPGIRWVTYLLGICVLYTVSSLCIAVVSSGAGAGDREESTGLVATEDIPPQPLHKQREWHNNMFFALLVPALLGIRFALGDPKKNEE